MKTISIAVLLGCSLTGCSGFEISQSGYKGGIEKPGEGYVFYAPKPMAFLTCKISDSGAVSHETEIKYVPDYSKPYTLKVVNRLGDADLKFMFTDGWNLAEIGSNYKSPETTTGKLIDIADSAIGSFDKGSKSATCQNLICELSALGTAKEACTPVGTVSWQGGESNTK